MALSLVTTALAAFHILRPRPGADGLAVYAGLYSTIVALTWRPTISWPRRLALVTCGALLGMLTVFGTKLAAHGAESAPGQIRLAMVLTGAAGLGAASYGAALCAFGAGRSLRRIFISSASCVVATVSVLALDMQLMLGGFYICATWWWAFSASLWWHDWSR